MKIYFIRHEERDLSNPTYLTPLTTKGLENANSKIKDNLSQLNITTIFCSPFMRTLQTIDSFSQLSNLVINIEYSLSETLTDPLFENNDQINLNAYPEIKNRYLINSDYQSFLDVSNLKYPETENAIYQRCYNFMNHLYNSKIYENDNILICSHQGIINGLLSFYGSKRELNQEYSMGQISIVDEEQTLHLHM